MSETTRAAVIGVVGTLIGAVAGATGSYFAQDRATDRQYVESERQAQAVARGTARLMAEEFKVRADDLHSTVSRKRYPAAEIRFSTALSAEDRRQVAARISDDAWEVIASADVRIARLERLLERHRGEPIDQTGLVELRKYVALFGRAADALANLSRSAS